MTWTTRRGSSAQHGRCCQNKGGGVAVEKMERLRMTGVTESTETTPSKHLQMNDQAALRDRASLRYP